MRLEMSKGPNYPPSSTPQLELWGRQHVTDHQIIQEEAADVVNMSLDSLTLLDFYRETAAVKTPPPHTHTRQCSSALQ